MCSGIQDFFAHHDRVAFRIEAAKQVIDILIFTLYFKSSTLSNILHVLYLKWTVQVSKEQFSKKY